MPRPRASGAATTTQTAGALMRAETWFSAEQAVEVGLADRVEGGVSNAFDVVTFRRVFRSAFGGHD